MPGGRCRDLGRVFAQEGLKIYFGLPNPMLSFSGVKFDKTLITKMYMDLIPGSLNRRLY